MSGSHALFVNEDGSLSDPIADGRRGHPFVVNVVAVKMGPRENRVIAVEWGQHDPLTCDGTDLVLNTDGWLACPVSACTWSYDPEYRCPVHEHSVS